jgi:hypothetical protein
MDNKKATMKESQGISKPRKMDVLFGRGGLSNNNLGNKRYQILVKARGWEYARCAERNAKTAIAWEIVRQLKSEGVRFLQKDKTTGLWFEQSDDAFRKKVSQRLRERALEVKEYGAEINCRLDQIQNLRITGGASQVKAGKESLRSAFSCVQRGGISASIKIPLSGDGGAALDDRHDRHDREDPQRPRERGKTEDPDLCGPLLDDDISFCSLTGGDICVLSAGSAEDWWDGC